MREDNRLRLLKVIIKRYRDIRRLCDEEIMERCRQSEQYYESFDWFARLMQGRDPDMATEVLAHTSHVTEGIMLKIEKAVSDYGAEAGAGDKDMRRQFDILYERYFAPEKMSVGQMAVKYGISRDTVFRDTKKAMKHLAGMLLDADFSQEKLTEFEKRLDATFKI